MSYDNIPDEPIEVEYRSNVRILDSLRSADAVRAGRHPGSERELAAVDNTGRSLVTAFECRGYWHIDVEYRALQLVGIRPLGSNVTSGFRVRTEEEAVDWLEFLSWVVTR